MKSIILMMPALSGGTHRHCIEMVNAWSFQINVFYIEYVDDIVKVMLYSEGHIIWEKIGADREYAILNDIIEKFDVGILHIHHFMYMNKYLYEKIINIKVPLVVTLHDYFTICPKINLFNNHKYCKNDKKKIMEKCNQCIKSMDKNYFYTYSSKYTISAWRDTYYHILKKAVKIIVPSYDTQERILNIYNDLKVDVVYNPEIKYQTCFATKVKREYEKMVNDECIKVGVIGFLDEKKGSRILKNVSKKIKDIGANIHFYLFGDTFNPQIKYNNNVTVCGRYKEDDVFYMIEEKNIDFFWFPNIWPETYSYVLTIPLCLKIPILAANIGAISERVINRGVGEVYPIESSCEEIISNILNFKYDYYKRNGDYIIKNNSFGDIESFYGFDKIHIEKACFKKSDLSKLLPAGLHEVKKLSYEGFKYMTFQRSALTKIYAVTKIDINRFIKKIFYYYKDR